MGKWIILFLLNLTHLFVVGQNRISGEVIDTSNKSPLEFANIFINNSTIGTNTDQLGKFELLDVPSGQINLIVSFVGYEQKSYLINIPFTKGPLVIELIPASRTLNEVVVKADRDRNRERYFKLFEKAFFGHHAEKCKIINPEIIDVYEDENGQLVAEAYGPLEIVNTYLGYRILFYLRSFKTTKNCYEISGYSFFQSMSPNTELILQRWKRNRSTAYLGSINHFTKALVSGTLNHEGFKLYVPVRGKEKVRRSPYFYTRELNKTVIELPPDSLVISKEKGLYKLNRSIEVHYTYGQPQVNWYSDVHHQVSWIESRLDTVVIDFEGNPSDPMSILTFGDISLRRISEMLPLDDMKLFSENRNSLPKSAQNFPRNKDRVYLHLSKPYYFPGDSIWYKPYIRCSKFNSKDSMSNVLYVDLINANREVISSNKINIKDTYGNFILPDSITGAYFIRAYTSWSRNFGDSGIYYVQVPVLSNYQNIGKASISLDDSIGVTIRSFKNVYGLRDKIMLEIQATDSVIESSLSISVVDSTLSLPWRGMNTIIDNTNNVQISNQQKGRFQMETSLRFSGFITSQLNRKSDLDIHIVQPELDYFVSKKVTKKGEFEIDNLEFYNSKDFIFLWPNSKKVGTKSIAVAEQNLPPPVPEYLKAVELQLETQKDLLRSDDSYTVGRGTKLLKEVEIRAKRSTSVPPGEPNYVITGDKFRPVSQGANLLLSLKGRVPGMSVKQYFDEMGMKKVEVKLLGMSNSFFYVEPLILVDSIPMGGVDNLNSLDPELVDRIEIVNSKSEIYGPRSSAGIISIITKMGPYASINSIREMQNFNLVSLTGYKKPIPFFSPDYYVLGASLSGYDYRSTLYWNSDIKLNDQGIGQVEFFSGDIKGTYRCIVEGLINNKPVRGVYFIQVRR